MIKFSDAWHKKEIQSIANARRNKTKEEKYKIARDRVFKDAKMLSKTLSIDWD